MIRENTNESERRNTRGVAGAAHLRHPSQTSNCVARRTPAAIISTFP